MGAHSDALDSSDDIRIATPFRSARLRVGQSCRVAGVLHSYLGPARLQGEFELLYAFSRREWRPHRPDQVPVTLVRQDDLARLVVPLKPSHLD
jgi:hypothetical protein